MENLTIVGMKDVNLKLMKIEKHLGEISTSLQKMVVILNKQLPITNPITCEEAENEQQ